jgi:hypothetical protein
MRALPQNIMDKGISELFSKGKEAWSRSMAWWTGSKKAVHGGVVHRIAPGHRSVDLRLGFN